MKIVIDLPDDPAHAAGPFPWVSKDAAGYVVAWVERDGDSLKLLYTVGRDERSIEPQEADRGDRMMKKLEELASRFSEVFNEEFN